MNSKFIASTVIAIAALTSASAFAQNNSVIIGESDYTPLTAVASQVSRAQVQSDLVQARKDGSLPVYGESGFALAQPAASVATRAEVHANAVQWVRVHAAETVSN